MIPKEKIVSVEGALMDLLAAAYEKDVTSQVPLAQARAIDGGNTLGIVFKDLEARGLVEGKINGSWNLTPAGYREWRGDLEEPLQKAPLPAAGFQRSQ